MPAKGLAQGVLRTDKEHNDLSPSPQAPGAGGFQEELRFVEYLLGA